MTRKNTLQRSPTKSYLVSNHAQKQFLVGGFKHVLFSPRNFREDSQFDEHIFQMGWFNHQPVLHIPMHLLPLWFFQTAFLFSSIPDTRPLLWSIFAYYFGWIFIAKWVFPKIGGTPKSSMFIGFSIINHPFLGYPYFWKHPNKYSHALNKTIWERYMFHFFQPPNNKQKSKFFVWGMTSKLPSYMRVLFHYLEDGLPVDVSSDRITPIGEENDHQGEKTRFIHWEPIPQV